jgi:hypothetical protein
MLELAIAIVRITFRWTNGLDICENEAFFSYPNNAE